MNLKTTLAVASLSTLISACGAEDDTENAISRDFTGDFIALDATANRAYANFESGSIVSESDQWQFSYQKYVGFSVNGGVSGEGNVSACIAHTPDGLFDDQGDTLADGFKALTLENTLDDFNRVEIDDCESDFKLDGVATEIDMADWLDADYTSGAPVFSASSAATNGWIVRSSTDDGNGNYNYARIKVDSVDYISGTKRAITLSVENWNTNALHFDSVVLSPELDFTDNRIYWDMESNDIVAANDNWDLSVQVIDGRTWAIQVNGGVSGEGDAAVATLLVDSASDVTDPVTTGRTEGAQVYSYNSDSASSALSGPAAYGALAYGVDGGHKMWPTFTTYVFKDETKANDTRFYKMQIVSNYGADGTLGSGNLYVRYAELSQ